MEWLIIMCVALIAGTIGGIIGFGSGVIMVPILAWTFGAKAAVPIMAIAALMANGSRVAVWWREVDWAAATIYSATAIPFAILGASTFLNLKVHYVELGLGIFLIAVVPVRHMLRRAKLKLMRWQLAIVGAGIGFLTGIVASTGPINAPFFLAYGLTKGAYLSTEALGSVAVGLAKTGTFTAFGAMSMENVLRGLGVGSGLMAGSFTAKRIVQKMDASQFEHLMDAVVLIAGIAMLWMALR
jgi:uncharacterized protein